MKVKIKGKQACLLWKLPKYKRLKNDCYTEK